MSCRVRGADLRVVDLFSLLLSPRSFLHSFLLSPQNVCIADLWELKRERERKKKSPTSFLFPSSLESTVRALRLSGASALPSEAKSSRFSSTPSRGISIKSLYVCM